MCQGILECEVLVGTRSAEGIMASGHVNRIKRPNTWLHRPMLQNREESSCQTGAVHTWHTSLFTERPLCAVIQRLISFSVFAYQSATDSISARRRAQGEPGHSPASCDCTTDGELYALPQFVRLGKPLPIFHARPTSVAFILWLAFGPHVGAALGDSFQIGIGIENGRMCHPHLGQSLYPCGDLTFLHE